MIYYFTYKVQAVNHSTDRSIMLSKEEREALREKLSKSMGVTIRDIDIRAIQVNSSYHWQPPMYIEVGKSYRKLEYDAPLDEVLAIFEANIFLVCTTKRGVEEGFPYMFARPDVTRVDLFE